MGEQGKPSTSWMPNELSRFVDHVDKQSLLFKSIQMIVKMQGEKLILNYLTILVQRACRTYILQQRQSMSMTIQGYIYHQVHFMKEQGKASTMSMSNELSR